MTLLLAAHRAISACRRASPVILAALLVVVLATPVGGPGVVATNGEDSYHGGSRSQVRVHIPAPAPKGIYDRQDPYFYGKERVEVPGSVAVNVPSYVCDLDGKNFSDKGDFVAHLRMSHGDLLRQIDNPFVVHEEQVHFVGK